MRVQSCSSHYLSAEDFEALVKGQAVGGHHVPFSFTLISFSSTFFPSQQYIV